MNTRKTLRPGRLAMGALLLLMLAMAGCAGMTPKPDTGQPDATAEDDAAKRQAQELFLAGKMAEAKEDWGDAAAAYMEALQYDPVSDEIAFSLARVFIRDGKLRSARHFTKLAVELKDDEPDYWQVLQFLEERAGNYGGAAEALRRFMDLTPEYRFVHDIKLSQYYFALGQPEKARDLLFERAMNPHTPASDVHEIAKILAFNELEDDALAVLTDQIDRDPLDVAAWLTLGELYEGMDQEEQARVTYDNALEANPDNLYLIVAIGNHCLVENDWVCAINYFEQAGAADEEMLEDAGVSRIDILKTLTAVYFYAGREDDATGLFNALKEGGHDDPHLYFSLGKAMNVLERYDEAAEYYRTGFAMDLGDMPDEYKVRAFSGYAVALINTGADEEALELVRDRAADYISDMVTRKGLEASVYMELERYDDAISIYEWLAASDPERRSYRFSLSLAYDLNGQFGKAEEALQSLLDDDPEDALALNNLAYMYLEHDMNLDKALTMVQQALINDPHNGAYLDTLAWAYFKIGKLRDAEKHIERAIKWADDDDLGVIWEHYGDIKAARNDLDEAAKGYRTAIEYGEDGERLDAKLEAIGK